MDLYQCQGCDEIFSILHFENEVEMLRKKVDDVTVHLLPHNHISSSAVVLWSWLILTGQTVTGTPGNKKLI